MKNKIKVIVKKMAECNPKLYFFILSILTFLLVEILNDDIWFFNVGDTLRPFFLVLNIVLYYVMYIFVYMISGSVKLSSISILIVSNVVAVINYFVCSFRGIAFKFTDILSAKTAANVMGMYEFALSRQHIIWFILLAATIVIVCRYIKYIKVAKVCEKKKTRVAGSIVSFVMLIMAVLFDYSVFGMNSFDGWNVGGYALFFFDSISSYKIEKPEGYESEKYEGISKVKTKSGKMPNVIVIMNESFCDIERIVDIDTSEDVMPFFREFVKGDNIVEGDVYVNSYAGNTVNTEMEFLTASSLGFWGKDSVCYTMGYTKKLDIVPNWMQELGYSTIAMHPATATNYSRNVVYDRMQFQNKMFLEDYMESGVETVSYPGASYFLTDIVEDNENYKLLSQVVEKQEQPVFLFNITIQNHGGYTWRGIDNVKMLNEIEGEAADKSVDEYLSLIKSSDEAIKELIEEIKNWKEDTVVLFFGDHQPNITLVLNDGLSLGLKNKDFYNTPFFIWANYDIEARHNVKTSINYLQNLLFEVSGIGLVNEYQEHISKVREKYPILTTGYTVDKDGNQVDFEKVLEEDPLLKEYHNQSYKLIYDSEN